MGRIITMMA
jgi:hypothetical protein